MLDKQKRLDESLTIKYLSTMKPGFFTKRKILAATQTARKAAGLLHNEIWLMKMGAPYQPILDQILTTHFAGASDHGHLELIRAILLQTERGLLGEINLSDVAKRDDDEGYVAPKAGWAKGTPQLQGSIHLAFDLLSTYSETAVARIILHEATHKFADTEDYFYMHQPGFSGITQDQACDNADSFAYAGMSILRKRLITWQTMSDEGKH